MHPSAEPVAFTLTEVDTPPGIAEDHENRLTPVAKPHDAGTPGWTNRVGTPPTLAMHSVAEANAPDTPVGLRSASPRALPIPCLISPRARLIFDWFDHPDANGVADSITTSRTPRLTIISVKVKPLDAAGAGRRPRPIKTMSLPPRIPCSACARSRWST